MANKYVNKHVTNEERREFLKALGVAGALGAGGITLNEVREEMASIPSDSGLTSVGAGIRADLTGELDAGLLTSGATAFADAAKGLPVAVDRGLPSESVRNEFGAVAAAGQPVYAHLTETDFFEVTTEHLPTFTPDFLQTTVQSFVGSAVLAEPVSRIGLTGTAATDMIATVIANSDRITDYHWVASESVSREELEDIAYIPPMTQGAAGGALLWLDDLDQYLWQAEVLLTDDILSDAVWHSQSMAAGFALMNKAATAVATDDDELTDEQLGAVLVTGVAVQTIAQTLLPTDVYWVTNEMRAPKRGGLEMMMIEH